MESSYSSLFFPSLVHNTDFINYFGFLIDNCLNIPADWCYLILFSHITMSITRICLVIRPTCQAKKERYLLQSLLFSTWYKTVSETILFIIFKLIFFDKKTICYLTFSLISAVYMQQLNQSHTVSFFLIVTTS